MTSLENGGAFSSDNRCVFSASSRRLCLDGCLLHEWINLTRWSVSRRAVYLALLIRQASRWPLPALRRAKDSVTIGMMLEPPGLDPTSRRRPRRSARSCTTTFSRASPRSTRTSRSRRCWPRAGRFSPDLKTLTFKLKKGVKFQDGEPFSSKDVKFSFERDAGKDFDQQGEGVLRLDRVDRRARPDDRRR